jgi:HlyD family secretion protein
MSVATPYQRAPNGLRIAAAMRPALILGTMVALGACLGGGDKNVRLVTAVVRSQTVVATIDADGAVEPVDTVLIRSRSSGVVRAVNVDVGSQVKAGDVLVRIDTRELQNDYAEAKASLDASTAALRIAMNAQRRQDSLFQQEVVTAVERDSAVEARTKAEAQVAEDRAAFDDAALQLEQATVTAPTAGTIIGRTVSPGTVVQAATLRGDSGATMLRMADLSRVRMRVDVSEVDVHGLHLGAPATIVVDAFPGRQFDGTVEKIEPAAVVEQDVTMFQVLVAVPNRESILMPGMRGDVQIIADRRPNVPAIPVDAVRETYDFALVTMPLGVSLDALRRFRATHFAIVRRGQGIEIRPVELGARGPDVVEVRSGLAVGDTVVMLADDALQAAGRLRSFALHVPPVPASPPNAVRSQAGLMP